MQNYPNLLFTVHGNLSVSIYVRVCVIKLMAPIVQVRTTVVGNFMRVRRCSHSAVRRRKEGAQSVLLSPQVPLCAAESGRKAPSLLLLLLHSPSPLTFYFSAHFSLVVLHPCARASKKRRRTSRSYTTIISRRLLQKRQKNILP